jgi:hypothetical protein
MSIVTQSLSAVSPKLSARLTINDYAAFATVGMIVVSCALPL